MKINANSYSPKELIKILREWTELNQCDFGKSIGKSHGAIRKYESGERDFTYKTLIDICKKHNIKIVLEKTTNKVESFDKYHK